MDVLVGELVTQLLQFVEANTALITGIKEEIEELTGDLKSFSALLKEASKNQNANENTVLKDVVDNIRNVVSDAEDVISKYIVERKKYKDKGMRRFLESPAFYARVNGLAKEIQGIKNRVAKIRRDNAQAIQALIDNPNKGQRALQRMAPVVEEEDVVGFDDEAKIIKNRLTTGSNDLTFISIKGMAGLGKTTLTKMVFKDRDLQYEFFTRLWVYVSKTFNRKQIFLDILSNFTKKTKDFHDMTDENLAEKIKEFLGDGKYFIVMDDIWTVQDWECLKIAFSNNKKGSRVLVTTRHEKVASHIDSFGNPHKLKFLGNDESWELLEKKVFRKEKCSPLLEDPGRRIAIKCNGLPLAVVVIAGVLDKNSTPNEWKKVAEDPFPVINQENQSYHALVKLSYDHLPFHLKDCFLYLAAFPTGHEIATWKLIRMWIAEGFIPLMEGGYTSDLERTAEKYLEDLIDKNLLMVLKRRADHQIKTCRIHDTLHEFCKTEAASKNLYHEMDGTKHEVKENTRRLCVNSKSIFEFMRSINKPSGEHVRSFISSSSKEVEIPNDFLAAIPKSFPLLRVMDVEYLKFKMLPKEFYHLYHLRFLAVSTELKILPKLFSNLWNMQTLVFNTTQNSLEVKADIWSMPKLRHVHTNTSLQLPPPLKSSKNTPGSTEIKTLSTISPSSCTSEIFEKTPDLQKLGIRGNLLDLMENKGGISLFDNLHKLDRLENLKLIHDALQGNKLRSFSRADKFPSKLRKMTLCNTAFDWTDFNILASLNELEVLKLVDNAFRGEFCDVSNVVFKQLQYLRIERAELVSWKAKKDSFPVLKSLYLRNCTKLDAVPPAFGQIGSLKLMELYCTNKRATNSAQEIHKLNGGDAKKCSFQLSIYPPDPDVISIH